MQRLAKPLGPLGAVVFRFALPAIIVLSAACTSDAAPSTPAAPSGEAAQTTTTAPDRPATTAGLATGDVAGFPVEVRGAALESKPKRIVSLDASATEVLFAIGAGEQVIAADTESDFPADAPTTQLDAASPSTEAILGYNPDLVVITKDRDGAVEALRSGGVQVFLAAAPQTADEALSLYRDLGTITGNRTASFALASNVRLRLEAAANSVASVDRPLTVYHELDDSFFSASSHSLTGSLYQALGLANIADEVDTDKFGLVKVSAATIFNADPDLIVITDKIGYTVSDVEMRPGWSRLKAVNQENMIQVNAQESSRWGPRMADFAAAIASTISDLTE